MDSRLEALRGVPLFADLDDRSLEAISVVSREISVPAGEVLMLEGEHGREFYVIVEGTIHIEHGDRTVRSMTAGGFLGEIALLEHRPRTATATCVTDCRLLAIQQHEFDRLVDRFPSIYRRVKAAIVRRAAGLGGDPIA